MHQRPPPLRSSQRQLSPFPLNKGNLPQSPTLSLALLSFFYLFWGGGRGRVSGEGKNWDRPTASSLPGSLPYRDIPSSSDFGTGNCCLMSCKTGLPQLSPHPGPHPFLPPGRGSRKEVPFRVGLLGTGILSLLMTQRFFSQKA